jgi:nitronate monooxygenase
MTNAFCDLVGTTLPLQMAAMTRVATPGLVAAVANTGALGMMAVGRSSIADANRQIDEIEAMTTGVFGGGFIVPYLSMETLDVISQRLNIIEYFYGWPDPDLVLPGKIVGWQVGTAEEARAAVDAGCSYVIAQGHEAGGHVRGTVPLADLLPAVRAAVDVPVLASGGIGSAEQVRAAMLRGADAVRIGTRFLAATEADTHPIYLDLLLAATENDTEYCGLFDVGWPDAPVRVLASAAAAARLPGPDPVGELAGRPLPRRGTTPPSRSTTGQIEAMALYAGTSVGGVTRTQSAADIIHDLLGA